MSEEESPRVAGIPIWGVFLLFLGIVFLLQTLNVLPWGLWGTLWRFWPVLIIVIGVGILLRQYNVWLVNALIMALLLACLGIAIWQYEPPAPAGQTTKSYSEPLGSLERAQIEMDFTAGSVTMGSLPPSSLNFVEAGSEMRNGDGDMKVDFHQQGSEGRLHLSKEQANWQFWDEDGTRWQVRFNRNIPLTLDVRSAASNVDLDLSQLHITELSLDVDVGNYVVKMPSLAGTVYACIDAALANLEITIPDNVAVKLKADVDLSAFEVDESRFPRMGDYYMSQDFESAENRLELELDADISRVQVK